MPGETEFNPLVAIQHAVTRAIQPGEKPYYEQKQNLTPLEALSCYTLGSAYAEFMEKQKGSIAPGKLADFTVLSQDPTKVQKNRIKEIQIVMTIVGGKIVYSQ